MPIFKRRPDAMFLRNQYDHLRAQFDEKVRAYDDLLHHDRNRKNKGDNFYLEEALKIKKEADALLVQISKIEPQLTKTSEREARRELSSNRRLQKKGKEWMAKGMRMLKSKNAEKKREGTRLLSSGKALTHAPSHDRKVLSFREAQRRHAESPRLTWIKGKGHKVKPKMIEKLGISMARVRTAQEAYDAAAAREKIGFKQFNEGIKLSNRDGADARKGQTLMWRGDQAIKARVRASQDLTAAKNQLNRKRHTTNRFGRTLRVIGRKMGIGRRRAA